MIDKQAAGTTERNTSLSNHNKAVARGILNRATDAVNDYRASRLISLRSELDTRLAKAEWRVVFGSLIEPDIAL
ncbi:hypothetical protein BGX24_005801, partial [Mortierella sp. AD032]